MSLYLSTAVFEENGMSYTEYTHVVVSSNGDCSNNWMLFR